MNDWKWTCGRAPYTTNAAEAYTTMINILAVEYLIKTYDYDTYVNLCEKVYKMTEEELEVMYINLSFNMHTSSLGAMITQGDYDHQRDLVLEYLDGFEEKADRELDKELYEGDDVLCKDPWDIYEIEGYSAAYCKCGHVLHIKTPRRKDWHAIKCPKCGHITNLFCGKEGEKLSMNDIRNAIPNYGAFGD